MVMYHKQQIMIGHYRDKLALIGR